MRSSQINCDVKVQIYFDPLVTSTGFEMQVQIARQQQDTFSFFLSEVNELGLANIFIFIFSMFAFV